MRTLSLTAFIALGAGIVAALITGLTWPAYDAARAYSEALNAAEFAGAAEPSALSFMSAPADLYLGHTIALAASGTLIAFGLLGILLLLHARAVVAERTP